MFRFQALLIIFWQQFGYKVEVMRCTTPQSAQLTAPLKGKAAAAAYEGRCERNG